MNILQIATLNRPIRQDIGYGPIETVIYNIDKGLHEMGHHSIVACSGDSSIIGEQFTTIDRSYSEYWSKDSSGQRKDMKKHLTASLNRAKEGDIDIIHMHDAIMVEYVFKGIVTSPVPIVMTLHVPAQEKGPFEKWNKSICSTSPAYFVPISEYQSKEHHGLINCQEVIHHGIALDLYPFERDLKKLDYLFSIGRITADKGQDKAIEIAKRTGSRLIIAGNVQNKKTDREFFRKIKKMIDLVVDTQASFNESDQSNYFEEIMKPIIYSNAQIIYIGEVNATQKKLWYQYARATLFPIQWGEPFGLVLIESMACGTPVIAFNKGSVPEIIIHGKTGFVVDSMEEMSQAVQKIDTICPLECRNHIKDNFSVPGMSQKYSRLYQWILNERTLCQKISR
jgi:glycosyltransferase involved in cell wall biosynthesis